ncbi:hypothetical protein MAR_006185 [Mya arenaria]|uniref:Uncharacterized protein n=1 Tax=Mya arenaria TaxID=6604 RepID=A0ABY7D8M0_MYAAR|nr:hypothetical protein MAR_006185 [Mya arenaria]
MQICKNGIAERVVRRQNLPRKSLPYQLRTSGRLLIHSSKDICEAAGCCDVSKTEDSRIKHKNDMLQTLLQISINGPVAGSEEAKAVIHKAVKYWLKEKSRRKLPKKADVAKLKIVKKPHDPIMTTDASVQTEGGEPMTRDEIADLVRDEVLVYSKAFDLPWADDSELEDDYFD